MLGQYEEFNRTGTMPVAPDWELFSNMYHKDLEYYTNDYNIMRLEDEWIRQHNDGSDQLFGMVEVGRTDKYAFIDDILGSDIVWSVQNRNASSKIYMVNVYGLSLANFKDRIKDLDYNIQYPNQNFIMNVGDCTLNIMVLSSKSATISKFYHHHNMHYNPYTVVYKGIEYLTKRQLYYKNNKNQCYLEIGVNDKKYLGYGRRNMRISGYDYKKNIEGLPNKVRDVRYFIVGDLTLATYWVLITLGYKIALNKQQRMKLRKENYSNMKEFMENIALNDLRYVRQEC